MSDKPGIASMVDIAEGIREYVEKHRQAPAKLYILAIDPDNRGEGGGVVFEEFHGSYLELLRRLNNLFEDALDDEIEEGAFKGKKFRDLPIEELERRFGELNSGDGDFIKVYCVDDHKEVLC